MDNDVTIPFGPGQITADVDFKGTLGELSGYYRINRAKHNFDLIAGFFYTKLKNEVTSNLGPVPIAVDDTKDSLDPNIGVRWLWQFA